MTGKEARRNRQDALATREMLTCLDVTAEMMRLEEGKKHNNKKTVYQERTKVHWRFDSRRPQAD
ncbi:hypothetical protein E2C01_082426 [Portunus trituberculatus]|uniref:Uncharacterized protein n=1 Tax=Portunus trituberculatus TaxID=210409 RepID=A0A5B7ISB6_PORTR|nr:hypothetical protein [Portunus trituberculatus]